MTAYKGLGTYGNAVGVVTPNDHKADQVGMGIKTATPNLARVGLFYNGSATIVTGTAGMAYSVAAYTCVTQRSSTSGLIFGGNDGALSVATTAAPGSNSRIDVVYHWHREFSLDGVDSNPVIGVVQGTAAASPTEPSLAAFPGAIKLATIIVPAGVTATNSGTTIAQTAPFTSTDGGLVTVRNQTERDAGSWNNGQRIQMLSTGVCQNRVAGAWVTEVAEDFNGLSVPTDGTPVLRKRGSVSVVFTGGVGTLTFPVAFPTACASLVVGLQSTVSQVPIVVYANTGAALSKTAPQVASSGGLAGTYQIHFDAIGW